MFALLTSSHHLFLLKVEANVRCSNEDARDFIRSSVLDIWSSPFPAYTPPLSHKALGKLAHSASKSKVTTPTASEPLPSPVAAVAPAGPPRRIVNHFVMNLPDSAIDFLGAFRGLYNPLYELDGAREEVARVGLPLIHCYCFTKEGDEAEKDILAVSFLLPFFSHFV